MTKGVTAGFCYDSTQQWNFQAMSSHVGHDGRLSGEVLDWWFLSFPLWTEKAQAQGCFVNGL